MELSEGMATRKQLLLTLVCCVLSGVVGVYAYLEFQNRYKAFKEEIIREAIADGRVVRTSQLALKGWPQKRK